MEMYATTVAAIAAIDFLVICTTLIIGIKTLTVNPFSQLIGAAINAAMFVWSLVIIFGG